MNISDVSKVNQVSSQAISELVSRKQVNRLVPITNGEVEIILIKRETIKEGDSGQQMLLFG